MLRIQFTVDDLVRTKLAVSSEPTVETVYAAKVLGHRAGGALFDRWRLLARNLFGRDTSTFAQLADRIPLTSELLALGPEVLRRGNPAETGLAEFHRLALAPFWERLKAHLDAERRARGEEIAAHGIDHLLATLHPSLTWRLPVLEIPSPVDRTLQLGGRGLLILPSVFRFDTPEILFPRGQSGYPVLVYPAALTGPTAKTLWSRTDTDSALKALVGRTRANLMRALNDSRTTTDLSRKLGVSAASVSQHTSVLRDAGLITTRRRQNTVLHSLTPLGLALVDRSGVDSPQLVAAVS